MDRVMMARFTSTTRWTASRLQPATTTRARRTREVARKIFAARRIGPAACIASLAASREGRRGREGSRGSGAGREPALEGLEVPRRNHEVARLGMVKDEGRDRRL